MEEGGERGGAGGPLSCNHRRAPIDGGKGPYVAAPGQLVTSTAEGQLDASSAFDEQHSK